MRGILPTSAIFIWAALAGTAQAQETDDAPSATVRFYPDSRLSGDWYGDGELELATQFCAASTSGRFLLRLEPVAGTALLANGEGVTVTLTSEAGMVETAVLSGATPVSLQGRNLAESIGCEIGANVRLALTFPESSLTASQAGSYFDGLRISVEPG